MGWRFRRTVRITKGIRINVSKTGMSLSLGRHGHTLNIGPNGTRYTVTLPGTGLSYTEKISDKGLPSKKGTAKSSGKAKTEGKGKIQDSAGNDVSGIQMHMNEKGQVSFAYEDGTPITDEAQIRKIKASPQYKPTKERLNARRLEEIEKQVKAAAEENEKFLNIHRLSAAVDPREKFEADLEALKPETYEIKAYEVPAPDKAALEEELKAEAEEQIKVSRFRAKKEKALYVEENLGPRYEQALQSWEKDRSDFEKEQAEEKRLADEKYQREFEENKAFGLKLLKGEEEAVCGAFDSWIASCELPVEIDLDYDWNPEEGVMMLDVELPGIEELPSSALSTTSAGNLTTKKKTQKELRAEYSTLVFGLAIFLSSYIFNISPAIEKILISGYAKRRDKEGNLNNDCIYSIKFSRDLFEGKDVSGADPAAFCMAAPNRCLQTETFLFRKVKPFEEF